MMICDERTGLPIADAERDMFAGKRPTVEEMEKAIEPMILSASGWRKVFAESGDGEDRSPLISKADGTLIAYAAIIFADHLLGERKKASVLVGIDARPTGPSMADAAIRMFLAKGLTVRYLFIAAAPEIMAENMKGENGCDGFFYISASHNPIGHNGIKFGALGGVYGGDVTTPFAEKLRAMVRDGRNIALVQSLSSSVRESDLSAVYGKVGENKKEALSTYENFVLETASITREKLAGGMKERPWGIVADFNGSARADSIDSTFIKSLNIPFSAINERPGEVAHAIVPEGRNLLDAKRLLEEKHGENPSYMLGYVPDNDGDRGNLVVMDGEKGRVIIPEAQEVFALVTMITLAETRLKNPNAKLAIAVNGPTSLRIDRIADRFDCKVFRAEVGEANVVALAGKLRKEGYIVKILGEGSNGGNITHPAKVRDPMNTIVTLMKLLAQGEIFSFWRERNNFAFPGEISLSGALASLPPFISTGAFSKDATLHVHTEPGMLKRRYEQLFLRQWEERRQVLEETYGLHDYTFYQTEGVFCRKGMGEEFRHAPWKGGEKVCFRDRDGRECAFIWMRPSGTEPVFRILADSEGSDVRRHDYLLAWQRQMVTEADRP